MDKQHFQQRSFYLKLQYIIRSQLKEPKLKQSIKPILKVFTSYLKSQVIIVVSYILNSKVFTFVIILGSSSYQAITEVGIIRIVNKAFIIVQFNLLYFNSFIHLFLYRFLFLFISIHLYYYSYTNSNLPFAFPFLKDLIPYIIKAFLKIHLYFINLDLTLYKYLNNENNFLLY